MTYQPFLIANFATGLDREVQPWLLVEDAFVELLDGFVYRGVSQKRDGYSGYANGLKSTYVESRMVVSVSEGVEISGDIDGMNDVFTITLIPPVVPGSLSIVGDNPAQTVTDDGAGSLVGDGTGTVNYVTGAVSVTFTAPPAIASTITVTYTGSSSTIFTFGIGTPTFTGILSNTPISRGSVTITAGAQSVTDDGIGGFTGDGTGSINYTTGVFSVTFNADVDAAITVTYDYHPGLPVMGIMNFYTTSNTREMLVVDTREVNIYNPATDRLEFLPSASSYNGDNQDFWSWVNYADASSNPRLLFCNGVIGDVIQQYDGSTITDYAPTFSVGSLNARMMFEVRDRLVLFQTIENGVLYPRRIRISGFGTNCDNFDITAPGAGFIDIPDNTWFFGADFNRDDILFFTEAATWMLKYTGNDVTPFVLEKIDGSRGSRAAFSVKTYLNRTMAASPRGLILSDGYQVERMDNNLPDFSFNEINNEFFESCFTGFLDEERDMYLIYPSKGIVRPALLSAEESDRILTINFEEDNFAIYRIPLSCMGAFQNSINLTWDDLTEENGYPNWDALGAKFNNWNAFPYSRGTPVAIGGGHKGEVWKLNQTEGEDNPQKIRNVQVIDATTLRVTTDWNNYEKGDYIYLTNIGGTVEANNKQAFIKNIVTDYYTFDLEISTLGFSAYTEFGEAAKVIPFEFTTKKLNPYVNMDKKVKCGWCYFYVSTVKTVLTDIDEVPVNAFVNVDVFINDVAQSSTPSFTYQIDCSNKEPENGSKKWVKIWINQTARFIQFRLRNNQAGAKVQVHAIMPGFQPLGRLV